MHISPLTRRRLAIFRSHKRGYWSLWIFLVLFCLTLFAEFIANDRPLLIRFDGHWYVPVLQDYSEDTFGDGFMPTEADYGDPEVQEAINAQGWMIWPPIPYSYNTVVKRLPTPAPSPPDRKNLLGTDDQARDVLARVIYGFRISVLFGFTLTAILLRPRHRRRRHPGLSRRPRGSAVPAFHRDLVRHAAALPADHPSPASSPPASGSC